MLGGMICRDEPDMDDLFHTMDGIHRKSFKDLGGEYIPRDENETTCAIRLPPNEFFKVLLGSIGHACAAEVVMVESNHLDHVSIR